MFNYSNPYAYNGISSGGNFGYTPQYYNSFSQPQQQNQQPQQTQIQPQTQVATNTNKIYVSGLDDVKGRFLSPNSDVLFIDNDKPLLYQKVVDSKGQFEIKVFDICPHVDPEQAKSENSSKLSDYVLKTDLEPLEAEIKALNTKLEKLRLQKEVDAIKKDEIKPLRKPDSQ